MLEKIKETIDRIDSLSRSKKLKVISHFDTDGITSAAIFSRALERWGKKFSLEVVKGLDEDIVKNLPEEEVLIFLDLASNSMDYLKEKNTEIFVFDHHEIIQDIPKNVFVVNPFLEECEMVSSAAVCYLFAKTLSLENKNLANLAVIGMVGDMYEKDIGKIFDEILKDSETNVKKGILIYPSTRPLNLALEYSSNPFIPGVTGSREGVRDLLRDAGIGGKGNRYKALCELSEEEMKKLVTAIMLRGKKPKDRESIVGNLFLVKFFNKLEDARELSASINACGRMGRPEVSLGFCLGNKVFRKEAEKIYIDYKQNLISALKYISTKEKLEGKNYMIFHGGDRVKDTIIGTVASILSNSPLYPEGQVIVALTYNEDKIKVSARVVGRKGRNVRDVLHRVVVPLGGEVGGHSNAAGCLISKEREDEFIESLKKALDVELVRV
jgi:single-stranded-DNA-specific exonuclease